MQYAGRLDLMFGVALASLALATIAGCGQTSSAGPPDGASADAGRVDTLDAEFDRDAFAPPRDASRPDATPDAFAPLGAPYPIVLAHGFFGFEAFAGIDMISYFFGVRADLAMRGEGLVFTPAVDPFNDSTVRGEQLIAHIEAILAETGHARVNIIGHSQGGLDARYVASVRPDLVASVTTISTPHRGTPLLDFVVRAAEDTRLAPFLDDLVRVIGGPLYDAVGNETSIFSAMRQLSLTGAATFTTMYPDDPDIPYFSIAGRSGNVFARAACAPDSGAPAFLSRWNSTVDPVDPLLALSESLFDGTIFAPEPNDGLVPISSARWGRFLGCVPADHLDEMGHLFGDEPGVFNRWDHLDFYADLVAWLRAQGY